jgi:anhydro-N-acetylmuramic acid kinase
LKHRFFFAAPPKSTGREIFGEQFIEVAMGQMKRLRLSRFDLVATLTALTARSMALNYRLHLKALPDTLILTGGGAANPRLVDAIKRELTRLQPTLHVHDSSRYGWPWEAVEGGAFALLAYLREQRAGGNLPETTGARHAAVLGQVSWPPG